MNRSTLPSVHSTLCPNPAEDGRSCYLCGGERFSLLHEWEVGDRWNPASRAIAVWQCGCGIVVLHPVPTCHELPAGGEWWCAQRKRHQRRKAWKKLRTRVVRWLFGSATQRLVKQTRRAVKAGRLLDVGCGNGQLLAEARRWFDCAGLDPSPVAAASVRAQGIAMFESTFEEAGIEPHSFDVVTMDSVIEHVHDPGAALAKVNSLLAPGGIIAVKTPKFGGPAYRMHGAGWNGFRHGYHTFLFSGATLGRSLQQAGFEVLHSPRRDRPLDDILILWGRKTCESSALRSPVTATRLAV